MREAVLEVRTFLHSHPEWQDELSQGKMFGVLVVEAPSAAPHEYSFIAAFSGLLNGTNCIPYFVPPIYDLLPTDGHFQQEQARIEALSQRITTCQNEIERNALQHERRQRSETLQDWLFAQFLCLNAKGHSSDILHIFTDYYHTRMLHPENYAQHARTHHIPGGTGECCAPKLLQYAYLHHLRPLCMGEFWVGSSTTGEVRHDGQFYPACESKCRPLLSYMLQGLDVETDARATRSAALLQQTSIIYQDDSLLALSKPSGLLSVPGRNAAQPSVLDWLKAQGIPFYFPAHRLDQDTSGLLLVARTRETYTQLQQAFQKHEIQKTYLALLCGHVSKPTEGKIRLPLSADPDNRPRQRVDLLHGKNAVTLYRVLRALTLFGNPYTLVEFRPSTGRTHQLRLHAAHPDGLGCPIAGDPLYGIPDTHFPHLCLHASSLTLRHPLTGETLHLTTPPPFSV